MKKLFFLLIAIAAGLGTMYASDTQVGGIWYDFDTSTKTATVTYRGSSYDSYSNEYSGSVVIPSSVVYNTETYTVKNIGYEAFYWCTGLTSVTIPNSVTSIKRYAFSDCTGLASVIIPNSVTSIGDNAFADCYGLTSIIVSNGNTKYDSRNNCNAIIETATNTLILGCKNTTIPNSVTSIGSYAFNYCTGLTSINIPNSVTSIGREAFGDCTSLTSVAIPNSVSSIGNGAFGGCRSLSSVTIPNSVSSIGNGAFGGCRSLTSVTIGNSVTSIGENAFSFCTSLTSVTIPNSVTSIGDEAFRQCYDLTSITIPNSVTSIGNSAFLDCSGLTSVTIPNSVTSIGGVAFAHCTSLTSVTIGNSVTSIGSYAFSGCSGLTSVTIPNSVTIIGNGAFEDCTNITSLTCEAVVPPSLGYSVFTNINKSLCTLHVPCGSLSAYRAADVWQDFGTIVEMPCATFTITWKNHDGTTLKTEQINNGETPAFTDATPTKPADAQYTYSFIGWTPELVPVTGDATYTAVFEATLINENGTLPGLFSVSDDKKVYYSRGNLQYQASTDTWRFAEHQYDTIGAANVNISPTYSGWISLFSWGTGNNPTYTAWNNHPYPNSTDWGANAISNGGNKAGMWRTLNDSEMEYLISSRNNAANLFAFGTINGIKGLILLPDNWTTPAGVTFVPSTTQGLQQISDNYYTNSSLNNYSHNIYTLSQWQIMESAGAVFLPAEGARQQKSNGDISMVVSSTPPVGMYWSRTMGDNLSFNPQLLIPYTGGVPEWGLSVRLVRNQSYTIRFLNYDGTELQSSEVASGETPAFTGATPTKPADAQYNYTFSGWSPAVAAVSGDATYTATYTATPRYTITFNANGGLIPTGGNMGNTPSGHITTLSTDRTSGTVVVTKDKSYFQTMTNDCPSREGYIFAGWYTDPTSGVQVYDNTGYRVVGTYWNNEGNWIGTSNVTLYAHWTPIPHTITVNSSNVSQGTATGGGIYGYGTKLQITATPNECYQFTQWSDGNTDNPRTIIVNGDATYTAEFSSAQYTIKVESADEIQGTVGVELVSTVGKEKDRIYYTSSDGNIVTPYSATVFGANIVSNTYQDGQGVMIFDRPVVGIGEEAFWNCDSLTSITIPNSVTSIGNFAFGDCESLTSVTIPNSVKSIGEDAFYYCSSLTSITIPNSVASIGRRAFYECFSLSSVTIPNSVTIIREAAFGVCLSLTSITIPNSVTIIEYEAFISCISLTSITIPNSVTSIDIHAFGFCDSLTSINVADDNPNYCSMDGVLFSKDRTTLILCPKGKQGAYTIPNSVTSIGEWAFSGCSSLTSVTIPNSVTSIGDRAFTRCSSLTSITIPNSVTSIGEGAFGDCESLTAIIVDSNNPNYCSVDGVLFNKDQTTLIQNPIGNTRSEYTIPNSVTSIGYEAFNKCSSLTSVTIPNSVTSIGNMAFTYCSSLTSVTIPNSLTSIGSYAFSGCSSLTSVTFEGLTPPIIGARVFNEINNYPIYVPYGTKDAYVAALNVNNTVYASRVIEK